MDTLMVPSSVYIDGQWHAAHWAVEVVDESSGELVITATVAGPGAPRVAALRMDMDLAQRLRAAAGFGEGPAPDGSRVLVADYDCRTTEDRLNALEQQAVIDRRQLHALASRVDVLENDPIGIDLMETYDRIAMRERAQRAGV
jgi:hypothetical protein